MRGRTRCTLTESVAEIDGQNRCEFARSSQIYRDASSDSNVKTVFAAALRMYPYRKCFASLYKKGLLSGAIHGASDDEVFEQLMTAIGKIVRIGTSEVKRGLLATLHAGEAAPMDMPENGRTSTLRAEQPIGNPAPADLAGYTMALKEYGDRHGDLPVYSYRTVSLSPHYFDCVATIGGRAFEAGAKSKKLARHLASQEACQSLGVKPF